MEMRLLLAFVLMGAVMLAWNYLTPQPATTPPGGKTAQTGQQAPQSGAGQAPAGAAEKPAETAEAAPASASKLPTISSDPQPAYIIDTDLYRVSFSNQGGTLRSWVLKKFKGNDGKQLELVNPSATIEHPFSLYFPGQAAASKLNWAWFKQTGDADGLGVTYEYSDGAQSVRKEFRFEKNSYMALVFTEVIADGKPVPHSVEWRGGFGDLTIPVAASNLLTLYYDLDAGKLEDQKAGAAKNGPVTVSGDYSFAGLGDKYFAAVFLPEKTAGVRQTTFGDWSPTPLEAKAQDFAGVAVSGGGSNRFRLFVGPKDLKLLKSVDPKLVQVVDFRLMWIPGTEYLSRALFWVVDEANNTWVHNFGWSIVLVTVILNFLLFPLKWKSMKSARKMQALKPQIDAINAKYKNIGFSDPKMADKQAEVSALFKKHDVSQFGGCLPMVLQMPFLFAFYKVFTVSVVMRGATWLWVTDLSQSEHLEIKLLPIIMIATQFLMQKMTPQPNVDPNQKTMMYMMPLVMGFMFYQLPSGLVLYYLTSNLVNIGQQWFFNHTDAARAAELSVQAPKKKNGRK